MPHTSFFCHLFSRILFHHIPYDGITSCFLGSPHSTVFTHHLLSCNFVGGIPPFLPWPYHDSRFCLRNVVIGSMLDSIQISSFTPMRHCWLYIGFIALYLILKCIGTPRYLTKLCFTKKPSFMFNGRPIKMLNEGAIWQYLTLTRW